ncbi:hypothetical protein FISHEDRAFT_60212 [Fistulina hepatica ATCC 64428]|uniref:Uncharacterized protein n=1 Tax=Fistulina hepatica ATCC 64428 TaxID=1128425 RepID=A0A0D7A8B6_9AGAR|nr:hypothetical protein FISHEDRAFT_60212 [Fistulina hepatica ATCC 64428]
MSLVCTVGVCTRMVKTLIRAPGACSPIVEAVIPVCHFYTYVWTNGFTRFDGDTNAMFAMFDFAAQRPSRKHTSVPSSFQPVLPSQASIPAVSRNVLPYPFMFYPPSYLAKDESPPNNRTPAPHHENHRRYVRYEPYSRAWRRVREMSKIVEEPESYAMKEVETSSTSTQSSSHILHDVPADRAEIEARGNDINAVVPQNPVVRFLQRLANLAFAVKEMILAPWRRQN